MVRRATSSSSCCSSPVWPATRSMIWSTSRIRSSTPLSFMEALPLTTVQTVSGISVSITGFRPAMVLIRALISVYWLATATVRMMVAITGTPSRIISVFVIRLIRPTMLGSLLASFMLSILWAPAQTGRHSR